MIAATCSLILTEYCVVLNNCNIHLKDFCLRLTYPDGDSRDLQAAVQWVQVELLGSESDSPLHLTPSLRMREAVHPSPLHPSGILIEYALFMVS
jgi:hypothetical protein